jgi:hypothetical protein
VNRLKRLLRFKRKNRGSELIKKTLGKEQPKTEEAYKPLEDGFVEESPSPFVQMRKFPYANPAEVIETVVTGLVKKSLFLVEVREEGVNAAVISRKGSFLDISLLKSYSNEAIRTIYRQLIQNEAISQEIPEEVGMELIIPAVISDLEVNLPTETVIIHEEMVAMYEVAIDVGRFGDDKDLQRGMLREVGLLAGADPKTLQLSVIKKVRKKKAPKAEFHVCAADKEVFEQLQAYLEEGGYALKRMHALSTLLFASLWQQGEGEAMLLYAVGNIAYLLQKATGGGFEYNAYDLAEDMESVELLVSSSDEVVLCGEGSYYEYLKEALPPLNPQSRCWDYRQDLPRAIIRVERGVALSNAYAMIVAAAYNELFNNRFAAGRLGVTARQSVYELLADNVSVLPFVSAALLAGSSVGMQYYFAQELEKLKAQNDTGAALVRQESTLKKQVAVNEKKIKKVEAKIAKMQETITGSAMLEEARMLHRIARTLRKDMVLERVVKDQKGTVTIAGRCYDERSLVGYLADLDSGKKRAQLRTLDDALAARFEQRSKGTQPDAGGEKSLFLNNAFTVELR